MRIEDKHIVAAKGLARGWTNAEAAKAANVCERTLFSWRQDPDFRSAIETQLDEQTGARANSLTPLVIQASAAVSAALASLVNGLGEESPALRANLKAATDTLSTLIGLEKDDGPSRNLKRVRAGGLNEKDSETSVATSPPPGEYTWDPAPAMGIGDAAATTPKAIRDAEGETE